LSTTPGDAETYERLNEVLARHHGDTAAWERLGQLLKARRQSLDPRYGNRRAFAEERLVPLGQTSTGGYKLAYDIEGGPRWGRRGFTLEVLPVIAAAYGVTIESIAAALDGGRLEPLHPPAPAQPAPGADSGWLPPLGADAIARARPYADQVFMARSDWRAAYAAAHPGIAVSDIPEPPGAELFPDSDEDARTWDGRAGVLSVQERVWLIAALRAREAARERQAGTGLSLIPGITSRSAPGHN
jgi:hypothetical protein